MNIDYELWALPGLRNGDRVILAFNGTENFRYDSLEILPPKADDFNWGDQTSLRYNWESGNNKGRLIFTASEGNGRYLVNVSCYNREGPYDFVVESIAHVLRVDYVPRPTRIPVRGTFVARVVDGTGSPVSESSLRFSLYANWGRGSQVIGTASPAGGSVRFSYRLPSALRGRRVTVWVASPQTGGWLGVIGDKFSVTVR